MEFKGKGVSAGVSIGPLFHIESTENHIERVLVENVQVEFSRFLTARTQAATELGTLAVTTAKELGTENSLLFEIHKMMLEDLEYQESIEKMIIGESLCAEYAVQETAKKFSELFSCMDDDYMRARATDVIDVSNRVINILQNKTRKSLVTNMPCILCAEEFTPSETAQLDRSMVRGLIAAKGSENSHTAIFARTMGIPAIVGIGDALKEVCDGTTVGVDGADGIVYVQPDTETMAVLVQKRDQLQIEKSSLSCLIGQGTETRSGKRIKLYANIGSVADADTALANDAEGVGLFRSEFLYLENTDYPSEAQLFQAYKTVAEKMCGRQIIIRTLDIGADKQVSYFNIPNEENPAMGLRAIRICLKRPEIFKTQLRAILRASAYGNIAIMFPMIISLEEIQQAKLLLGQVKEELDREKIKYNTNISVGIMIETPASAIISDRLASEVDFFSIGTNDLTQYTLAVDRQNEAISSFCNPYHEAVMRLIDMTIKNAKKAGIEVGICGELAADVSVTQKLIEMGIDELSVSPAMILVIRNYIRGLN